MASPFNGLDPRLIPHAEALYAAIRRLDPAAVVTSVRRSRNEQQRLYNLWLAGKSKYPAAAPGTSKHEQGLAFDIVARPEVLRAAGLAWERAGGTWGGRIKVQGKTDDIHFQV